jgi:hypothetical protein
MARDITFELAESMLKSDDDLPVRLQAQDAALQMIECTDADIGQLVDVCEVPFLLETLALGDEQFWAEFPAVKSLDSAHRKILASTVERHCETCPHCSLKVSYDLDWAGQVERLVRDNGQVICGAVVAPGEH